VRYSAQRRVVFRGSWIRNDPGPRSSTKVDQYGFTLVRFNDRIPRNMEPYVLPATVRQVLNQTNIRGFMLECGILLCQWCCNIFNNTGCAMLWSWNTMPCWVFDSLD
jgi:hypothetical protein